MLNISKVPVTEFIKPETFKSFQQLERRKVSNALIKILSVLALVAVVSMFLPWTQNIRSKGYVTTMNPFDRPQAIQSVIDGQIVKWYSKEGDFVSAGDTILQIKESKDEYLDPEIIDRTQGQFDAKSNSSLAYANKVKQLQEMYKATEENRALYLQENTLKIEQTRFKINADSLAIVAATLKFENESKQLDRLKKMYDSGIESLTSLEKKRFAYEESRAKLVSLKNKLDANRTELKKLQVAQQSIRVSYDEKLAKIKSDEMSAKSSQFKDLGEMDKLQSKINQLEVRKQSHFIISPVSGLLTKAVRSGVGEFVKSGENLITIVPDRYDLGVEIFVRPRDIPLLEIGQDVRIQFDGWPAIVFSGWPNTAYGTFPGIVTAIDRNISDNGKYRILIAPSNDEKSWPEDVMIGGGAEALILLKDVRVYYELWRQLNGFPPDYYKTQDSQDVKSKAPLRKIK